MAPTAPCLGGTSVNFRVAWRMHSLCVFGSRRQRGNVAAVEVKQCGMHIHARMCTRGAKLILCSRLSLAAARPRAVPARSASVPAAQPAQGPRSGAARF